MQCSSGANSKLLANCNVHRKHHFLLITFYFLEQNSTLAMYYVGCVGQHFPSWWGFKEHLHGCMYQLAT